MDKLRILLVDDSPTAFYDAFASDVVLSDEYAPFFELSWVQNPSEGRWLLEVFDLLVAKQPGRLRKHLGLPAEIVIFDYAVTHDGNYSRSPGDASNVISRTHAYIDERGIPAPEQDAEVYGPSTGMAQGKDRTGCYLGVSLARSFATHPCGAIPTTAHVDTRGTDAAFFEWLNAPYFEERFAGKHRAEPSWGSLIPVGVQAFRNRILSLVRSGLLRISLEDINRLHARPADLVDGGLRASSRFGDLEWPIRGVFADLLIPHPENLKAFEKAAKQLAAEISSAYFANPDSASAFQVGRRLSKEYLDAWSSEIAQERAVLSSLAVEERDEENAVQFRQLLAKYTAEPTAAELSPEDANALPQFTIDPIFAPVKDPLAIRWAVLMLAVRLEQREALASEDGIALQSAVTGEHREQGVIPVEDLVKVHGPVRAREIITNLRIEISADGESIPLPIARHASRRVVLEAMDPLPKSLLIESHRSDQTKLTNRLKRLGQGKVWGTVGLSLRDLFNGRPFDCEICMDAEKAGVLDPEHPKPPPQSHGIRPGEGEVLRLFANEIGFAPDAWPKWLAEAP